MTEAEIDSKILEAEASWNVPTIAEIIASILSHNPELTLLDIEDQFRKLDCKTYLVAWPPERIPEGYRAVGIDGSEPKFGLWVCLHDKQEMIDTAKIFGMTVEQNRENLKQTGIGITIKTREVVQ